MKTFEHKIDKKLIPTCNIMGVDVAAINMEWLLDFTFKNITKLSGDYCCVSNVHTIVTSWKDRKYRIVQNGGIMAIPDGKPLSFIGRKRGHKKMGRTAGPDYMHEILRVSMQKGYTHFFYGSTEKTLEKIRNKLLSDYPEIKIVGMYSPPFRKLTDKEDRLIISKINDTDPDFVWVGIGAPKQEKWMAAHQGKVKGFMVGVGAGFDYLAGNIKRAPVWLQKAGMEWIYRLLQEPARLLPRYLSTNILFIWHACVRGR